jgi:ABC-type phosphate transport system permease subunit
MGYSNLYGENLRYLGIYDACGNDNAVVIVATEEAIRAIPRGEREASYALGATKLQTIKNIVLPRALPGIMTGMILAISRAAGEVAPIIFTGVAYFYGGFTA